MTVFQPCNPLRELCIVVAASILCGRMADAFSFTPRQQYRWIRKPAINHSHLYTQTEHTSIPSRIDRRRENYSLTNRRHPPINQYLPQKHSFTKLNMANRSPPPDDNGGDESKNSPGENKKYQSYINKKDPRAPANPSILPPVPTEASERFPNRRGGRLSKKASRIEGRSRREKGGPQGSEATANGTQQLASNNHEKSNSTSLPPPGLGGDTHRSSSNRKRTRPGRGSGRGTFATIGSRKFKPRKGEKFDKFKESRGGRGGQTNNNAGINGSSSGNGASGDDDDGDSNSLLPPKGRKSNPYVSELSVLTSWDDFFATSSNNNNNNNENQEVNGFKASASDSSRVPGTSNGSTDKSNNNKNTSQKHFDKTLDAEIEKINDLPSPSYLFGDSIINTNDSAAKLQKAGTDEGTKSDNGFSSVSASTLSSLDGVLPVSELFYRSTQSISGDSDLDDDDDDEDDDDVDEGEFPSSRGKDYSSKDDETDDEELPFSAEQSDQILTRNNKILMRRNQAGKLQRDDENEAGSNSGGNDGARYKTDLSKLKSSTPPPRNNNSKRNRRKRSSNTNGRFRNNDQRNSGQKRGRKMVRRGMEMLVGGEPINADPPLRFVELDYCLRTADALAEGILLYKDEDVNGESKEPFSGPAADWASVVTTNSRDFGPLLHKSSVGKVSETSRQLYCEHFIHNSMKWNVCPKDLRSIVENFEAASTRTIERSEPVTTYNQLVDKVSSVTFNDTQALELRVDNSGTDDYESTAKGFGKDTKKASKRGSSVGFNVEDTASNELNRAARRSISKQDTFTLGGELKFCLGVTRSELETGNERKQDDKILRRVLGNGIAKAIKSKELGFNVVIAKMVLNEIDGGSTEFNVEFNMIPEDTMKYDEVEYATKRINSALAKAMDDGDMALSMGAAAKAETSWPDRIRDRVVEEFLFDGEEEDEESEEGDTNENDTLQRVSNDSGTLDDDDDFEALRENEDIPISRNSNAEATEKEFDGPFGMPGDTIYAKDDIYLGGGNGGVFPDYSENGKFTAPFKGELGPLLVDAVTQRAIERQPRVIAIGDVHGCIDELQALLRRCDYRPGDLIVFLGDLVSKGPDSLSVVQMARELGAIGVRGNHDFEVIRWHQAIKSGAC